MVATSGFNNMMSWINTANKTIDNYNTIKKIIKPKESDDEETKKKVVVETKAPAIIAKKS